jgi:hypothetical protein
LVARQPCSKPLDPHSRHRQANAFSCRILLAQRLSGSVQWQCIRNGSGHDRVSSHALRPNHCGYTTKHYVNVHIRVGIEGRPPSALPLRAQFRPDTTGFPRSWQDRPSSRLATPVQRSVTGEFTEGPGALRAGQIVIRAGAGCGAQRSPVGEIKRTLQNVKWNELS